MNETTVTTPNELEIRVERVFDAPPAHVRPEIAVVGLQKR